MTCRKVQTRRLTVNLRVEGNGPPLLYLGGSSFDLSIRAPVFDSALPRHFTVAAADPRGLGATDAPDGDWTMQDYTDDAVAVMDALGWERAFVLGESFGAMIALNLARSTPHRVLRMALAAGAPGGAGGSSYPIERLSLIEDPRERMKTALTLQDSRFADRCEHAPEIAEAIIEDRMKLEKRFLESHNNRLNHARLLAARARHDCWSSLPAITIPTLVIAGRYDNQAPLDRSLKMAATLPHAEIEIFPAGHNVCFASAEPVQWIVEKWSRS